MSKTSCDSCNNYVYDEEYEEYYCGVNFDEDEQIRFMSSSEYACPYYQILDEYKVVRKQGT